MTRTFALLALLTLLVGCTRYGTRANGPFARHNRAEPNGSTAIPPGPAANISPLALASDTRPQAQPYSGDLIPPRQQEPLPEGFGRGAGIDPAGGFPSPVDSSFPPRRRTSPTPEQLPSPFAPKEAPQATPPLPATPEFPRNDPIAKAPIPTRTPAITPTPTPAPAGISPPNAAGQNLAEVKKLVATAAERWAKVDTYEALVSRKELSPKKIMNNDVVVYHYRKEPMAVYLRNIDEANAGRQIIYNPSQHGDKVYAIIGKGDANLLFKAGAKAPVVSPDMPLVKDKTRYSIREAGYGTPIARVAMWVGKVESGKIPADALTYLGPVTLPEFKQSVAGVKLILRPGDDVLLPKGGTRQWFYDINPESPAYGFPVLIIATEPDGKEVEYYLFEKLKFGVPFKDSDFSPERLDKKG